MLAIDGASETQLNWKPAAESRSIAEICRHLIRVEGWFLQQMDFTPVASDPETHALRQIQDALHALQNQLRAIVQQLEDDQQLQLLRKAENAEKALSLDHVIKHISQHRLYHVSQIIYLRRAQDRSWSPPLQKWETTVNTISELTWKDVT